MGFHDIIDCLGQYIDCHYNEEEIIYDNESYENYCILERNYRYLLRIASSVLKSCSENLRNHYLRLVKYVPIDFDMSDISKINLNNIMAPFLETIKY